MKPYTTPVIRQLTDREALDFWRGLIFVQKGMAVTVEEILRKIDCFERATACYWRTREPSEDWHTELKRRRAELVTAIEEALTKPFPTDA